MDEARQEHDHLPDEVEQGEAPTERERADVPAEGGITAPDPAKRPDERNRPPGNPEIDEERLERNREDYDRTVPG